MDKAGQGAKVSPAATNPATERELSLVSRLLDPAEPHAAGDADDSERPAV